MKMLRRKPKTAPHQPRARKTPIPTEPVPVSGPRLYHVMPPDSPSPAVSVVIGKGITVYPCASDGTVMVPARAAEEIIRRGGTLVD